LLVVTSEKSCLISENSIPYHLSISSLSDEVASVNMKMGFIIWFAAGISLSVEL
jgi:hypothetical protein